MDNATTETQQASTRPIEKVIVHPLVLLSVVDHYNRYVVEDFKERVVDHYSKRDANYYDMGYTCKRAVGVLLGSSYQGTVRVSNSFAVPFYDDDKEMHDDVDHRIWFLDCNYLEEMLSLFRRLNAKEHVVGWYSTYSQFRPNDPDVHRLFRDYSPNPVLVFVDITKWESYRPTRAYCEVEEVKELATGRSKKVFVPVPSEIAGDEAEEIGVDHFIRDIKEANVDAVDAWKQEVYVALMNLWAHIWIMIRYLKGELIKEDLPLDHEILNHMQAMFRLLPNLEEPELKKALTEKLNDMALVTYLCSMIRMVIAFHNLVNNKIMNKKHGIL